MAGFQIEVTTTGASESVTLPLVSGQTYNCTVDWGEGSPVSVTAWDDADATHTYVTPGTYTVEITGRCDGWSVNNTHSSKPQWTDIIYWGDAVDFDGFAYLYGGFHGCTNLASFGTGAILSNGITTLRNCFRDCQGITVDIPDNLFYNCVDVTSFFLCFYNCFGITHISAGLFYTCTLATDFGNCFVNNLNARISPWVFYPPGGQSSRFINQSINFTSCFQSYTFSGDQGQAPDLWNCDFGSGTPTTTNCYDGAGNSLTSLVNYNNIPSAWGGAGYVDTPPEFATVDLTDVGNATEIDITGTNFEASGGALYACNTNVLSDSSKVLQTIDTQGDTAIGATITGLSTTGTKYLYLIDSDDQITDSPWSITFWELPTITNISDSTLVNGQTGVVLTGTDFMSSGATLELCNNSNYASATIKLSQTITAQNNTQISFTVNNNDQIFGNKYLFLTTSIGQRNVTPYTVNIGRTVYFFVTNNGSAINSTGFPVTLFE
jgi:hypothetical protein